MFGTGGNGSNTRSSSKERSSSCRLLEVLGVPMPQVVRQPKPGGVSSAIGTSVSRAKSREAFLL